MRVPLPVWIVAALFLPAAPASALHGEVRDGVLLIQAGDGDDAIGIDAVDGGDIIVTDNADRRTIATAGAGCTPSEGRVVCRTVRRVTVRLGAGTDSYGDTGIYGTRLIVAGGPGNDDLFTAASGRLLLAGGPGSDEVTVSSAVGAPARLVGGAGDDILHHSNGWALLDGGPGNDELVGGPGGEDLRGGSGRDFLLAHGGHDRLAGGADHDRLRARDGVSDRIFCGSGGDGVSADRIDRPSHCP